MQIIYLKPIFVIGLAAFFSNELTKGGAPEDAIVNICTQVRTATRFHRGSTLKLVYNFLHVEWRLQSENFVQ